MTSNLSPQRERWLLFTLAGIQFTSVLDFMIMMPLGLHILSGSIWLAGDHLHRSFWP